MNGEGFAVKLKEMYSNAEELGLYAEELKKCHSEVESVKRHLRSSIEISSDIGNMLTFVLSEIEQQSANFSTMGEKLSLITSLYTSSENSLVDPIGTSILEYLTDFLQDTKENFEWNFKCALLSGAGEHLKTLGGLINVVKSLGKSEGANSFVLIDPSVAKITCPMISTGAVVMTAAKYGLPIIGGIIDYAKLRSNGEQIKDALIKANVHVGIGVAAGVAGAKIGAASGALIGSIIPGAGTAAGGVVGAMIGATGAVIGILAGAAITSVGNTIFDVVYDNVSPIEVSDNTVYTGNANYNTFNTGAMNQNIGLGTVFG